MPGICARGMVIPPVLLITNHSVLMRFHTASLKDKLGIITRLLNFNTSRVQNRARCVSVEDDRCPNTGFLMMPQHFISSTVPVDGDDAELLFPYIVLCMYSSSNFDRSHYGLS